MSNSGETNTQKMFPLYLYLYVQSDQLYLKIL